MKQELTRIHWKEYKKVIKINKEISNLEKHIKQLEKIRIEIKDLQDIVSMEFSNCKNEKVIPRVYEQEIKKEYQTLLRRIKKIKFNTIFTEKEDLSNAYIDIQSGAGGIDAQDWSKILLNMYLKWAHSKDYKAEIIFEKKADIAGIKEAHIKITGDYVYGFLKHETGIHRLIRKSPFDISKKRHTSFASVFVYPENESDSEEIEVKYTDLRIDTYRAGGAGGQHVNRTESAVRITHIPTNITVQCQNERSQHQNKNQALRRLKLKIKSLLLLNKQNEKKAIEECKLDITWGNQIRSYVFDDGYVKDIRTGIKTSDIQSVLNGNLEEIIKK